MCLLQPGINHFCSRTYHLHIPERLKKGWYASLMLLRGRAQEGLAGGVQGPLSPTAIAECVKCKTYFCFLQETEGQRAESLREKFMPSSNEEMLLTKKRHRLGIRGKRGGKCPSFLRSEEGKM